MTRRTLTIESIECDHGDCMESDEGLPGMTVTEVRHYAMCDGWRPGPPKDYCPLCVQEMQKGD